jgi:drug/metabolite transporter (DMT)-like permease
MSSTPSYRLAVVEAVFINIIWASSFIFVKMALKDLGPLTIGGLRYFFGFLILLPFILRSKKRPGFSRAAWLQLFLIGFSSYTVANSAMFWSLIYLPATTVSFLMGLTTLLVFFGGVIWLKEVPNRFQTVGIIITLLGTGMFFSTGLKPGEPLGIILMGLALLCFTVFGILGRNTARAQTVDTLSLTAYPLAIGGGLLLLIAIPIEGLPHASIQTWGLVIWLAAINTSLAYVLYNHSLQVLTAFQMNVMLNLAPIWTAVMGWFFLNEHLTALQFIGMVVVIVGVGLVQRRSYPKNEADTASK